MILITIRIQKIQKLHKTVIANTSVRDVGDNFKQTLICPNYTRHANIHYSIQNLLLFYCKNMNFKCRYIRTHTKEEPFNISISHFAI